MSFFGMAEVAQLDLERVEGFLQSSGSKNANSDKFTARRNFPPHQYRYWHKKNQQVCNDVENTVPEVWGQKDTITW